MTPRYAARGECGIIHNIHHLPYKIHGPLIYLWGSS